LPSLERLYQHFKDRPFIIIGVDIQEEKSRVKETMERFGITYPNILDRDGKVSALYGVSSTPTKFLIDKKGRLIGRTLGYREWDSKEIKRLIELLVEG